MGRRLTDTKNLAAGGKLAAVASCGWGYPIRFVPVYNVILLAIGHLKKIHYENGGRPCSSTVVPQLKLLLNLQ